MNSVTCDRIFLFCLDFPVVTVGPENPYSAEFTMNFVTCDGIFLFCLDFPVVTVGPENS